MKTIVDERKLKHDALAYTVFKHIEDLKLGDSDILYYNFPLYRGELPEDLIQAQILLASKKYGVVYFKCSESNSLSEKEMEYMDTLDVTFFSKFSKFSDLRSGKRDLKFPLRSFVICAEDKLEGEIKYISIPKIKSAIEDVDSNELSEEDFNLVVGCIEGTTKLITKKERKPRKNAKPKSKAEVLNLIQNKEAMFDLEQKKVALITIEGPQRIRGLAGSGKTIVLAMKAAQYHLSNPDAHILYTYYTKSLYGLIKNLIERFYRDFSDNRQPNWNNIHILHGWGGTELAGVYSRACADCGIPSIPFAVARRHSSNPFDYVCQDILNSGNIKPKYDLVLIDEGQDFPNHFYQLCYKLALDRRIVWAYDDFQNIFDVNLQDERETFGKDDNGDYAVDFVRDQHPLQDIVLHTCYRNPRLALITAFALGLGIYNKDKVLQRLEDNSHWEALGFKVESGDSNVGSEMIVSRPTEHTPNIMNEELGKMTISLREFDNLTEEASFVAESVFRDISVEGLRPDDICIICLDSKCIGSYYECISSFLAAKGIRTFNLLDAPNANKNFFYPDYVTLATINKAKGNEAGMVYIIGVDSIFTSPNNVLKRNMLFTAMTRTKGWVMLSGVGDKMKVCAKEIKALRDNDMKFKFIQPSKETTKTIESSSRREAGLVDKIHSLLKEFKEMGYDQGMIADLLKIDK